MAILQRVDQPAMPVSFVFLVILLLLVAVSFDVIKSVLPLLSTLNEDPSTTEGSKLIMVTKVPLTFSIVGFAAMPISGFVIEMFHSTDNFLYWALSFWAVIPLLLYSCSPYIVIVLVRAMAIFQSFFEPAILAFGAQVYSRQELNKIYMYFIFTYITYQVADIVTRSIAPIDMVEYNICNNLDCNARALIIASVCAFIALFVYLCFRDYFNIPSDGAIIALDGKALKSISYKLLMMAFVLMPYGVFWIFYQQTNIALNDLPKLIYLYGLGSHTIVKWFGVLKIIIAILFYHLVFKKYKRKILQNSTFFMTMGGILLGLWAIVARFVVNDHMDQYSSMVPTQPDSFKLSLACLCHPSDLMIDVPFYKKLHCSSGLHLIVDSDIILATREDNRCPLVWTNYNSLRFRYCFHHGQNYIAMICSQEDAFVQNDRGIRDSYGRTVICCAFQTCDNVTNGVLLYPANKAIGLRQNETLSRRLKMYQFWTMDALVNQVYYDCQTIDPGYYNVFTGDNEVNTVKEVNYTFEAGAVYLILKTYGEIKIIATIPPFKSSIFTSLLLPVYLLRATGDFLLMVNGLYFVYIQMPLRFRTFALSIWLMFIKFGMMVDQIDRNNDIYYQHDDLFILGIILIVTSYLSFIMQNRYDFLNIDQFDI